MKKGFIALSAGIALAAFAIVPAAAQMMTPVTPASTFLFETAAYAQWANFTKVQKAQPNGNAWKVQDMSVAQTRVRPELKLTSADGHSFWDMRIEYDGIYGQQTPASFSGTVSSSSLPRDDDQTNLEVAWMFFHSDVTAVDGLSVNAGCVPVDWGFWYQDNIPLFGVSYIAGPATITFNWATITSPLKATSAFAQSQKAWLVEADAIIKTDFGTIQPIFGYTVINQNVTLKDKGINGITDGSYIVGGIKAKLAFGDFKANAQFETVTGSAYNGTKGTAGELKTNYSGFVAAFAPTYNLGGGLTVGAVGTYMSGDKGTDDSKVTSFGSVGLDQTPGEGVTTSLLFEDTGTFGDCDTGPATSMGTRVRGKGTFGDNTSNKHLSGYILAGVNASATIGIYTPTVAIIWGQRAEKLTLASGYQTTTNLGYEFDLQNNFQISANTNIIFLGAYMIAKDGYKESATATLTNPYVFGFSLQQKL